MASVRACAPWGLDLPQRPGAAFHAITSGTAWARVDGSEPLQLMPGDVFLLPAGARHRLLSDPDGDCVPFNRSTKERLLTPVIHMSADPVAGRDVAAIVGLLAMEVGARRPGSRAAAARLIDTLLI